MCLSLCVCVRVLNYYFSSCLFAIATQCMFACSFSELNMFFTYSTQPLYSAFIIIVVILKAIATEFDQFVIEKKGNDGDYDQIQTTKKHRRIECGSFLCVYMCVHVS